MIKLKVSKVDTLKHVSDHGLNLVFTDKKTVDLLNALKPDGSYRLESGKSFVEIVRCGHITFTDAFFSVGSNRTHAVHYMDGSELAFTLNNRTNGEAVETLRSIILGETLPRLFRPKTGAEQDTLRTWLRTFAWTLTGEAGLRAKAIHGKVEHEDGMARTMASALNDARRNVSRHEVRNYEQEKEEIKADIKYSLNRFKNDLDRHLEMANSVSKYLESEAGLEPDYAMRAYYGLSVTGQWDKTVPLRVSFPGKNASLNYPVIRANYTVKMDGQRLLLSSNIECPFSVLSALDWLKGGAQLNTRYGIVQKVNGATEDGKALTLIKCGCHYIDVARDLGGEFTELLKPTHEVVVTEAEKTLFLDEDKVAFQARIDRKNAEFVAFIKTQKQQTVIRYIERMAKAKKSKANHGAELLRLLEEVKAYEQRHASALAQRDLLKDYFTGASLDACNATGKAFISAFKSIDL